MLGIGVIYTAVTLISPQELTLFPETGTQIVQNNRSGQYKRDKKIDQQQISPQLPDTGNIQTDIKKTKGIPTLKDVTNTVNIPQFLNQISETTKTYGWVLWLMLALTFIAIYLLFKGAKQRKNYEI